MRGPIKIIALSTIVLVLGASCMDRSERTATAQEDANKSASVSVIDAAPVAEAVAEAVALPPAPLTGTHLDGAGGYQPATHTVRPQTPPRSQGKSIELVLRSTPPGAIASIDGKPIGNTPTLWLGKADGQAHEYTFTKQGYSMARYRFVSTQSGVVHGSLSALVVGSDEEAAKRH